MSSKTRCHWAESDDLYILYHDEEWGVPSHSDHDLFENLCLEGAQAGLSWLTILKKRDNYRKAFDNFNWDKISKYDEAKFNQLMQDAGIVRNRLKINAFIENAKAIKLVIKEFSSFNDYIWAYVSNQQVTDGINNGGGEIANTMSKDLKKRGFRFVGPTICYGFMQAKGLVNDHTKDCFRFEEIKRLKS